MSIKIPKDSPVAVINILLRRNRPDRKPFHMSVHEQHVCAVGMREPE